MADDIVERLRRDQAAWLDRSKGWWDSREATECGEIADEIERLRAENERYYLLFTKLQNIAGDRRFSDEFVGRSARRRLGVFAAATKEDDRG